MTTKQATKRTITLRFTYQCGHTRGFAYILDGVKGCSLATSWVALKRTLNAFEPTHAPAECPKCSRRAESSENIVKWFGLRRIKANMSHIPQGTCKDCRNGSSRLPSPPECVVLDRQARREDGAGRARRKHQAARRRLTARAQETMRDHASESLPQRTQDAVWYALDDVTRVKARAVWRKHRWKGQAMWSMLQTKGAIVARQGVHCPTPVDDGSEHFGRMLGKYHANRRDAGLVLALTLLMVEHGM